MSKRQARIGLSLGQSAYHNRCDSKKSEGGESAFSHRHCLLVLVSRYRIVKLCVWQNCGVMIGSKAWDEGPFTPLARVNGNCESSVSKCFFPNQAQAGSHRGDWLALFRG